MRESEHSIEFRSLNFERERGGGGGGGGGREGGGGKESLEKFVNFKVKSLRHKTGFFTLEEGWEESGTGGQVCERYFTIRRRSWILSCKQSPRTCPQLAHNSLPVKSMVSSVPLSCGYVTVLYAGRCANSNDVLLLTLMFV